jgi:cobalt-zinc-cadmium efflux system outer membrane protein
LNRTVLILTACALAFAGCAGTTPESELLGLPPLPSYLGTVAVAPGDSAIGFAEAVARVLAQDPALQAARHRVLAADAARVQAGTWTNPLLRAEAEGWGIDHDGFDQSELTLSAAFPLDLVGKRGARVSVAQAQTNVQRSEYNETRRGAVSQVRSVVLSIRAEKERESLAAERLSITEETAAAVSREVTAGKAAPLEQVRAEVIRESARTDLARARFALRQSRLRLGSLLGWPTAEVDVTGALRRGPVIPDRLMLGEELSRNPRRLAVLWSAESARRTERRVGREKWPDVEAEVGLRRFMDENANAWVTGLSVGIPLWDRKAGASREARELTKAADQDVTAVDRELQLSLADLLTALEASQETLGQYQVNVLPRAQDALDLARRGFEGGKFGYLDLLEAQRSLLDVKREYLEARISYDEAVGRLESLLGREPGNGLLPETP